MQDVQRNILQKIGATIGAQVATDSKDIKPDQIDPIDMQTIIIPNICAITEFYNIPTQTCNYGTESDITNIPSNITDQIGSSSGLATWLKILFAVLGVLVAGFI
jgi:hypothetical protein